MQTHDLLDTEEMQNFSDLLGRSADLYQIKTGNKGVIGHLSAAFNISYAIDNFYEHKKGNMDDYNYYYNQSIFLISFVARPDVGIAINSYLVGGNYLLEQYYKWESYWKNVAKNPYILYY